MAPGELFLVASNIQFLDDTGLALGHAPVHQEALTAGNGSLEPQDDVFYLSRLNDPTTYFFQWICKRYRLTVKAEPHSCPICLETSENNIQLSCGHTFCRQCLKAAAEREMTSCALCRKSHTLDPDVLRAQFDQQRVANLSWRLGQTRATRSFSKPSWEAAAAGTHFASPLARTKEMLLASSAAVGGGGGASSAGGWAAAAEAEADDVKKLAKSASVSPRGNDDDKHEGPDIGALPRSRLLRRARASVKRALLNRDAGGMTPAELRSRWVRLMGTAHREQAHAAVLPPDVGAASVRETRARWGALLAPAAAGSPLDVGAAAAGEVQARMGELQRLADEAPECGAAPVAALAGRWAAALGGALAQPTTEVGAASRAALRAAWEGTARVGVIGRDVGALATAELMSARPSHALAPECGAAPVAVLSARLRAASAACTEEDVGGVARLPLPSSLSAAAASVLPEECGALPASALAGRWAAVLAAAACGSADAGAMSAVGLAARWPGEMLMEAGEDAGASSVAELGGRWSGLRRAAAAGGAGDVGACAAVGLGARWRAALTA